MVTIFDKDGKQIIKKLFSDYYDVHDLVAKYFGYDYAVEVID